MFNIKYQTKNVIINVYKKEDRFILRLMKIVENCGKTLKSLQNHILDEFGIHVRLKTVHNYISVFSYTLKNVSVIQQR